MIGNKAIATIDNGIHKMQLTYDEVESLLGFITDSLDRNVLEISAEQKYDIHSAYSKLDTFINDFNDTTHGTAV